jgi:hypothetical protein
MANGRDLRPRFIAPRRRLLRKRQAAAAEVAELRGQPRVLGFDHGEQRRGFVSRQREPRTCNLSDWRELFVRQKGPARRR